MNFLCISNYNNDLSWLSDYPNPHLIYDKTWAGGVTDNDNSAYFYDLNTKLSYKINDNNNVYFSGYFGRDVFSLNNTFVNTYGNAVLNLRWNHLFSDKLFSNMSFIYSDYYYGLELDFVGFEWNSGIKNYNFRYDFKHYLSDKLKLTYGLNTIYYNFGFL